LVAKHLVSGKRARWRRERAALQRRCARSLRDKSAGLWRADVYHKVGPKKLTGLAYRLQLD